MTFVVGQAFDAFSRFPLSNPSQDDRTSLQREVGIVAIQLVALGVAMLALSSATSALWICTGERILMRLRLRVYDGVMNKSMEWFEAKMGALESSGVGEEHSGSGGLMAKFAV
jgi:ATP-binding cassette subfamily B (MDR/TAP) protein 1